MRWLALLRGVSPQNAPSAALQRAFGSVSGLRDVRTVLSSGNVLFSAQGGADLLQRQAEAALLATLGRPFPVHLRSVDEVRALLAADPFAAYELEPDARRVVTFLRQPVAPGFKLPAQRDGVRLLEVRGRNVLTAYVPHPRGPRFMIELERTFGDDQTTRTWDSLEKCAAAA